MPTNANLHRASARVPARSANVRRLAGPSILAMLAFLAVSPRALVAEPVTESIRRQLESAGLPAGLRLSGEPVQAAMTAGVERSVTLPRPVPVHLQYWTAWAEEDGRVQFRRDIYGRYRANAYHGPFVHVDVRGYQARWGN